MGEDRVSETGFHQLTEQVVRQAGFSDISKVKIYGYGGNIQNEALLASELQATDDLQEVPQCIVGGKHYFYAEGPVSWKSETALQRVRNPYSDYGYYFITQTDGDSCSRVCVWHHTAGSPCRRGCRYGNHHPNLAETAQAGTEAQGIP